MHWHSKNSTVSFERRDVSVSLERGDEGGIAIICPGITGRRIACICGVTRASGAQHRGGKHPISAKLCFVPPGHSRRGKKNGARANHKSLDERYTGGWLRSTSCCLLLSVKP